MKKLFKALLSCSFVIGISATTVTTISCYEPANARNQNSSELMSFKELDSALNKWSQIKNRFIKDFVTSQYYIVLNQHEADLLKTQGDKMELDQSLQNKLIDNFSTQLEIEGFTVLGKTLKSNQFEFSNWKVTPTAYAKFGPPGIATFSVNIKFKNSEMDEITLQGSLDYVEVTTQHGLDRESFDKTVEQIKETPRLNSGINSNGYFLSIRGYGERDSDGNIPEGLENYFFKSEFAQISMDYISMKLRSANLFDESLKPKTDNLNIDWQKSFTAVDARTDTNNPDKMYFKGFRNFNSIVGLIPFGFKDSDKIIDFTGSYLLAGKNY